LRLYLKLTVLALGLGASKQRDEERKSFREGLRRILAGEDA
jgi:hypothetical protein